jgi:hypothetical protein
MFKAKGIIMESQQEKEIAVKKQLIGLFSKDKAWNSFVLQSKVKQHATPMREG